MNREEISRAVRRAIEDRGGSRVDDEEELIDYSIQFAELLAASSAPRKEKEVKRTYEVVEMARFELNGVYTLAELEALVKQLKEVNQRYSEVLINDLEQHQ